MERFFSEDIETNEGGGRQSRVGYRLDLVDPSAILRLGAVLKLGAEKHAPDNWRKIDVPVHLNHALGHVLAYLAGDRSKEDHLGHAFCRLMMACALDEEVTPK